MKEIIEADPRKEVLHLRASFGPRRETMKEIIDADTDPMKEVLYPQGNNCSHSHTKNYVVKFGPRSETMKEIIEADTDTKKEVLRLRPTFAPTPTQQIMLSNLGQGG